MADIVLFHPARGLLPGVVAAAERLRAAGHAVHVPDYYDGEVFDDPEAGRRKLGELGMAEILRRVRDAVSGLPAGLVYAGFSLGAGAAQVLAATRPGARGAILMHGVFPAEMTGAVNWSSEVPVQVHYAAQDPAIDTASVAAFGATVEQAGARFEEYAYAGSGHLFADPDLPDYDEVAAELMWDRVLDFLAFLDDSGGVH